MRRMDGSSIGIAIYEIRNPHNTKESGRMVGANRAGFVMHVYQYSLCFFSFLSHVSLLLLHHLSLATDLCTLLCDRNPSQLLEITGALPK